MKPLLKITFVNIVDKESYPKIVFMVIACMYKHEYIVY